MGRKEKDVEFMIFYYTNDPLKILGILELISEGASFEKLLIKIQNSKLFSIVESTTLEMHISSQYKGIIVDEINTALTEVAQEKQLQKRHQ